MRKLSQIIHEAEKDQREKKQEAQNTIDRALFHWAKEYNKKTEAERLDKLAHTPGTKEYLKKKQERRHEMAKEIILTLDAKSAEGRAWFKERLKNETEAERMERRTHIRESLE